MGAEGARLAGPKRLVCTRAQGARALIVDDDIMVRALTSALLQQMGCHCEAVATGAEASARVARDPGPGIDIVLLDMNLWREAGEAVCRRLRAEGFGGSVVAMSGDDVILDTRLRAAGFDAAIKKPFSAEDLHACVEANVGQSRGGTFETA
jgi:DNA-binding response OmpR family regulator